jgi:hypothetical protein
MNIDPNVAQRQADFIDALEEQLAELKNQPAQDFATGDLLEQQEPLARLNANIPQGMYRQFKAIASMRGESITDVVTSFVAAYIEQHIQG